MTSTFILSLFIVNWTCLRIHVFVSVLIYLFFWNVLVTIHLHAHRSRVIHIYKVKAYKICIKIKPSNGRHIITFQRKNNVSCQSYSLFTKGALGRRLYTGCIIFSPSIICQSYYYYKADCILFVAKKEQPHQRHHFLRRTKLSLSSSSEYLFDVLNVGK